MKKIFYTISLFTFFVLIFIPLSPVIAGGPSSASGQESPGDVNTVNTKKDTSPSDKYTLLAPFAGFTEAPTNIGDYLNKIFIVAIGLCGFLAFFMLVISGVQYMVKDTPFAKGSAKGQISNAIFGLLIALSAYALLNTLDPRLLGKEGLDVKSITLEIDPEVHGDTPHTPIGGKYCNGKYEANSEWGSDEKEREIVKKAGITINKNNCTRVGQSNCTSLTGLNTTSVISLKKTCPGCEIVITGGTECWLHSRKTEHLPGNSIVDLRNTTSLISYVEKDNKEIPKSGMNFPVFLKNTTKFMKEGDHYHIIKW
ncbi:MAG: hypothetical protein EOM85_01095 [Candidatus Moranbacteria bacterium]|nr:hypothetical protein [Candidatus Moranbacteria bacterium]